jgi:hypothetical protein
MPCKEISIRAQDYKRVLDNQQQQKVLNSIVKDVAVK